MTAPVVPETQGRQRHVGKVYASVTITNHEDEVLAKRGIIDETDVRSLTLERILVDTGANTLCLPRAMVDLLGLPVLKEVLAATAAGLVGMVVHEDARISILGREGVYECLALPDEAEPLLGLLRLKGWGSNRTFRTNRCGCFRTRHKTRTSRLTELLPQ